MDLSSGVELVLFDPRKGFLVPSFVAELLPLSKSSPPAVAGLPPLGPAPEAAWLPLGTGDTEPDAERDPDDAGSLRSPRCEADVVDGSGGVLPFLLGPSGEVEPLSRECPDTRRAMLIPIVGRMAGLCLLRADPPSSPLDDATRLLPAALLVLTLVRCRVGDDAVAVEDVECAPSQGLVSGDMSWSSIVMECWLYTVYRGLSLKLSLCLCCPAEVTGVSAGPSVRPGIVAPPSPVDTGPL